MYSLLFSLVISTLVQQIAHSRPRLVVPNRQRHVQLVRRPSLYPNDPAHERSAVRESARKEPPQRHPQQQALVTWVFDLTNIPDLYLNVAFVRHACSQAKASARQFSGVQVALEGAMTKPGRGPPDQPTAEPIPQRSCRVELLNALMRVEVNCGHPYLVRLSFSDLSNFSQAMDRSIPRR